jgi:hypothetical protein
MEGSSNGRDHSKTLVLNVGLPLAGRGLLQGGTGGGLSASWIFPKINSKPRAKKDKTRPY